MNNLQSVLCFTALSIALSACQADSDPSAQNPPGSPPISSGAGTASVNSDDGTDENGEVVADGDNADTGFPNDGSVGGAVYENDAVIAGFGSDPEKGFVCQQSASLFSGARIEAGANGIVGGAVNPLLGALSADTVSALLSSISDSTLALDNDLRTAATVTQTAAGLAGTLDSLDINVFMPEGEQVDSGRFAVFAVSFPESVIDLGLLSSLTVSTLLDGEVQEEGASLDATGISLLGASAAGDRYALVGYRTSAAYDHARLTISSDFLSADVGENIYIHEMCTGGEIVDIPVQ